MPLILGVAIMTLGQSRVVQLNHSAPADGACVAGTQPAPNVSAIPILASTAPCPASTDTGTSPSPSDSGSPSPSPSPSPSDSGSPSPSPSPSGSPSASPSPNGSPSASPSGSPSASPSGGTPSGYHAVTPYRILDTRDGASQQHGILNPGTAIQVRTTGIDPQVPDGQVAVTLNVTATAESGDGFLTVWPHGAAMPGSSSLNYATGLDQANLVTVPVASGPGGVVDVEASLAATHVVIDLLGYYSAPGADNGAFGQYHALTPSRVLDTRSSSGICYPTGSSSPTPCSAPGPGGTLDVQIGGAGGIPTSGVSAVAFNLTAADATAGSFVTAYPAGAARPNTSNLNFAAGQWAANRVVMLLPANGRVTLYNRFGAVHLVADVSGWYSDGSNNGTTGVLTPITPVRVFDSRGSGSGGATRMSGGMTEAIQLGSACPAGSRPASAVLLNLTAAAPDAPTVLTVYPLDPMPGTSDLDIDPAFTWSEANLVMVKLESDGTIRIHNSAGATDIVGDLEGCYN